MTNGGHDNGLNQVSFPGNTVYRVYPSAPEHLPNNFGIEPEQTASEAGDVTTSPGHFMAISASGDETGSSTGQVLASNSDATPATEVAAEPVGTPTEGLLDQGDQLRTDSNGNVTVSVAVPRLEVDGVVAGVATETSEADTVSETGGAVIPQEQDAADIAVEQSATNDMPEETGEPEAEAKERFLKRAGKKAARVLGKLALIGASAGVMIGSGIEVWHTLSDLSTQEVGTDNINDQGASEQAQSNVISDWFEIGAWTVVGASPIAYMGTRRVLSRRKARAAKKQADASEDKKTDTSEAADKPAE